jgi:hypothetical protein
MHVACALIVTAGLLGQPPDVPPFVKAHVKELTFYYKAPDPTLGPRLLQEFLKPENLEHPWLVKNDHVKNLIGAQLGDIAAGHPKEVRAYEAAFAAATPAGRRIILQALQNCGDAETAKQVDAWLADKRYADVRKELEALKKHLADPKDKHVRDRPVREPKDLDHLWASFFITGDYAPVARILDVFDLPEARENAVLKGVARWSLESNLKQHPKLVEIVQAHAKERPAASRKVLDELLPRPKDGKP